MKAIDPIAHLSIALPKSEREFILKAVDASDGGISAFIRGAALERARSVMGRDVEPPARVAAQPSDNAPIHLRM